MIDIIKAKKAFKQYVAKYNPEDPQIALKIKHISTVTNVAKEIAEELKLPEEDIKLAELIALLHDIGRFEQIKRYHTFADRHSINHGKLGVELLQEGLIRNFIEDEQYDNIIYTAILNHNKNRIEPNLDERTNLHAKIIRDADKTDIYNILLTDKIEAIYNGCLDMSKEKITEKIYKQFLEDKEIIYPDMVTHADNVVAHIAYVFDFNYKYGLRILKQNNSVEKLINRMNFKDADTIKKFENIKKIANEYIEERLK